MHIRTCIAIVIAASAHGTANPAAAQTGAHQEGIVELGDGRFQSPETVVWDEERDLYLLSNVNGGLTALDDNGFISRLTPDGEITELKWIDGDKPDIALHGPKGMLLTPSTSSSPTCIRFASSTGTAANRFARSRSQTPTC